MKQILLTAVMFGIWAWYLQSLQNSWEDKRFMRSNQGSSVEMTCIK